MITSMVSALFDPLLQLPLLLIVVLLSFGITLLTTLIYKWTTNQTLMKSLKDEIKSLQKLMKETKNNPEEAMKVNQKMMAVNSKYFMQSMKPLLFTMLPILLIFGWMQASLAYEPLTMGNPFEVRVELEQAHNITITVPDSMILKSARTVFGKNATFKMVPTQEGNFLLTIRSNGETVQHEIIVSSDRNYAPPITKHKGSIKTVKVKQKKAIALVLPIFGWKLGWLGTYIIFSILFSTILRKLLKVY